MSHNITFILYSGQSDIRLSV